MFKKGSIPWNKGKKMSDETKKKILLQRQQRREKWGGYVFSPETRAKLSQSLRGRKPWNKGIRAWNNGMKWPDKVKENISRGLVVYWIQRKNNGSVGSGNSRNKKT